MIPGLYSRWVPPFGYPRIYSRSQIPVAFRSPLRPSSPPDAKASTICPSYLDFRLLLSLPLHCQRSKPRISNLRFEISAQNYGGGERDRTDDPLLAKQVLSQLSYTPNFNFMSQTINSSEQHAALSAWDFLFTFGGPNWNRTNDLTLIRGAL